jgi:hypothetical protein
MLAGSGVIWPVSRSTIDAPIPDAIGLDVAVGVEAAADVDDRSATAPEQEAATKSDTDIISHRASVRRLADLVILDPPRWLFQVLHGCLRPRLR